MLFLDTWKTRQWLETVCIKGKKRLNGLIAFYDEMTAVVDKGTVADDVYFDFSKAFGAASNSQISEILSC